MTSIWVGGVDDVGGDVVEVIDLDDAGDLGHQPFDEPEVAPGDAVIAFAASTWSAASLW